MKYTITYYTLGDSIVTEEVEAESLEEAIEILIAEKEKQYMFAQLESYELKGQ